MASRALFGRSRELADLAAAFDRAVDGQGSVFLLSGEAGIGKTRLAEELTLIAQARGAEVFWGRAWEVEGAPACWPWVQVLRACARTEVGAAFLDQDPLGDDLAPLLPRRRSGSASRDPELESMRLSSAIVGLLQCLSRKNPVVMVFDDLHASDLASLNLLHAIARQLRGLRVFVVGTYRELEARRAPAISGLLTKLGREGTIWPLGKLDRGAVTQWVAGALGTESTPALASAVFTATEGNPLFVDALSQLLASRGQGISLTSGFALPDSIRETVQEMLARVSEGVREVLDAASVLGRECSTAVLQLVCDKPIGQVLTALDEGIAAGVLSAQPLPSSPVSFAHILIREALYQQLDASRRIELHASAVRALVRLFATDLDAHLAELAHHAFESGALGSWREAADFAARAGRRAMDLFAFDDAARHLDKALTALDLAESTDDARRPELLWRLGLCQIRTGQPRLGIETCERSAALAMQAAQPETYARAVLARGSEAQYGGVDSRLVELLESALGLGIEDDALRARVMARLVSAMMPMSLPDKARHFARKAIEAARASGDRGVLAEVLSTARIAFTTADDLDERVALGRELAGLATTLGDKLLALHAHFRLALDAVERGDPDSVKVELRIQRQLADETRVPQLQLRASWLQLLWVTLVGNDEDLAHAEHEARDLATQLQDHLGLLVLATHHYVRAELRGDIAGQISALAEAEVLHAGNSSFAMLMPLWRADVLVEQGRGVEARAHLLELFPDGPHLGWGHAVLARAIRAYVCVGEQKWMEMAYELLLPFAARNTVLPSVLVGLGPVAHHLGTLAAARGQLEQAAIHFREAVALCERAHFTDFEARSRRALGALGRAVHREGELSSMPTLTSSGPGRALARLGTVIRQYRLDRLLGIGGMAAVYAATHPKGQRVAIKVMHERFQDNPKFLHLFRREASVANQVGHVGAVPVLAQGVDEEGRAFLIMPLLEGETVRARWERANRRLPSSEVAELMDEVLDVLATAHAKGIVHRDIKPDNLFITTTGEVRVLDFGIARYIDSDGGMTLTTSTIGTPAFMSPEQAIGNRAAIGPPSDCWAAGATIFTLLSGELVHPADSAQAQLAAAATQPARSLRDVLPNAPPLIVSFVDKALAFDAADRWQSAREMREGLLPAFIPDVGT